MKYLYAILLLSVFLFTSTSSYSQDDDKKKGIRAGWQYSNFYSDGNTLGDNLSSFYVGVSGEKSIIPLLKFGSGLEYFQNGYSSSLGSETFTYKSHVISVPLYLKLKLGPVFALGGAAANFNVSQNYKLADNSADVPEDLKSNVFDVPLYVGLGVKILLFSVEARYYWGMLDASKSDLTSTQAQYFQIGAGISF